MIKLEGTVLNVFTQQGGTNKKGEAFEDRDRCKFWELWSSQTVM